MKKDVLKLINSMVFLIVVVCSLLLPKSGRLALLDTMFDTLVFYLIAAGVFMKIRKRGGRLRNNWYLYGAVIVLMFLAVWKTAGIARDCMKGPKAIVLNDVTLSELHGTKGSISLHYYMKGTDEYGKKYRIEISGADYYRLNDYGTTVTIMYYENVKRLYQIGAK